MQYHTKNKMLKNLRNKPLLLCTVIAHVNIKVQLWAFFYLVKIAAMHCIYCIAAIFVLTQI